MIRSFTRSISVILALVVLVPLDLAGQKRSEITIAGTEFRLDGEPFPYTGVSFFNAIYNPAFNRGSAERIRWIDKFQRYGINVLRVWGQWDNDLGFVDTCATCTLYHTDGRLRPEQVATLQEISRDAATRGTVILLALFARESWNGDIRLDGEEAYVRAAAELAREMLPHRNVVFQVWNEHSEHVAPVYRAIKEVDPHRLVTNSPGYGGDLGGHAQNALLDYLSPHTSRNANAHWKIAPRELALLMAKFNKPVVDDEPARTGTATFGGPGERENFAFDHLLRMYNVWQVGGYVIYHHDMFQTGYGSPAVPPSGIPDPEHNPYHRTSFDFLSLRDRYMPHARR